LCILPITVTVRAVFNADDHHQRLAPIRPTK
jgi:hypothetical protein